MSMESTLDALLKTVCARVFPDVAPAGTATPYATWQGIGGETIRFIDNTAGGKRDTLMQVSIWSKTRSEALTLIRQIEDLLCASSAFQCRPEGESVSIYESDTLLYGSIQRFSILASR